MQATRILSGILIACSIVSCSTNKTGSETVAGEEEQKPIRLITLDPGHFHAYLVQKSMYENVDSVVHVFAPEGDEVREQLKKIEAYNNRAEKPTHWVEIGRASCRDRE